MFRALKCAVLTLVLTPVAAVGVSPAAQAKPQSTPAKGVTKQNGGSSTEKTATSQQDEKDAPNVTVIVKQENSASKEPHGSEADENIDIQRKLAKFTEELARFTEWLVIVGFIQAAILLFTVWAIRHQAFVTKSSERAWMIGSPNMQKLDSPPESGSQLFGYVCNLKNTGRTPARILETGLALRTSKSLGDLPQTPSYKAEEISSLNKILLVPKDSFGRVTISQITMEEYIAVKNREMILYAYGFVKYLDIFDKPRETRFCHYYYVPGAYELQIEGFRLCVEAPPAYNMAT